MKNIAYLLALHSIDGLGPIRLKAIIDYFKDPKLAWEANLKEIRQIGVPQTVLDLLAETRKILDPILYAESIKKMGVSWLTIFDDNYPDLLKQIYDSPIVLYYKGEIVPGDDRAIAVVGTRKMTGYGKLVTEKFTRDLVLSGFTIVSGLARGIDTQAHKTALSLPKGRTMAVLGGGLNKIFPAENTQLVKRIAEGFGAVISEYPPDYPSLAGNFPSRNRIIAGLSLAVLITEAAQDSGSLITARLALEQGRDVFAVPGPITSDLSKGPMSLIKEGARPVFDSSEILQELGMEGVKKEMVKVSDLSENEKKIIDCLQNDNKHIDEICRILELGAAEVSSGLLKMEIKGVVRNLGSGIYCKIP